MQLDSVKRCCVDGGEEAQSRPDCQSKLLTECALPPVRC
jgi:hypothetical protein